MIKWSSSRHWGPQSYSLAEGGNNSPLTGMTVNSFECHSATIGRHQVTYKWQLG